MTEHIGVIYCSEGSGHVTRMTAIANQLQQKNASVTMVGGGPGTRFAEINGYAVHRVTPTTLTVDVYEGRFSNRIQTNTNAIYQRLRDLHAWIRRENPSVIVTDDPFTPFVATYHDIPYYWLSHITSDVLSAFFTKTFISLYNRSFISRTAETFFYPCLWEPSQSLRTYTQPTGPISIENEQSVDQDINVLYIPSTFEDNPEKLITAVSDAGFDVCHVGGQNWSIVPSLLPYIRSADYVISNGYGGVMESAVAGTPCIMYPTTHSQQDVASLISDQHIVGITTASTHEQIINHLTSSSKAPSFTNSAEIIASTVVN